VELSEADDPLAPPRRRRPASSRTRRGAPQPPSGDLIRRRLIALAIGAGVIVLLLFAIRGCLDARKERSFENYLRDLSALVATSNQLSNEFFERLADPGELTPIEFQDQLGSSRGTGEDVLRRAQGLDAPGELDDAQEDLLLAFELRRDGLNSIAEQMETALGEEGRAEAQLQIAADMRQFLASDVLYARAREEIEQVLQEEELPGEVPQSVFMTQPDIWLDELQVAAELAQVAGTTGSAGGTDRGTELSSVVAVPGNVPLTPDTLNTLGQAPSQLEITVLNGGTANEVEVPVYYELLGSTETIQGQGTIPQIRAGQSEATSLPVEGEIPTGDQLTLTVTVLPVPGESIIDNNEATYQVVVG
jgi:hypothetical protein